MTFLLRSFCKMGFLRRASSKFKLGKFVDGNLVEHIMEVNASVFDPCIDFDSGAGSQKHKQVIC